MGILAQVFRGISAIFEVMSDRENEPKKIFIYNGIYNIFCGVQYFLLNAVTGGLCCILGIIRNIILILCKKKKYLFVILPLYFAGIVFLSWKDINGWLSALPLLLIIMYSTALAIGHIYLLKYTIIVVLLLEMIYDFYYKAYVGFFVCMVDIVFVVISLIKLYKTSKTT